MRQIFVSSFILAVRTAALMSMVKSWRRRAMMASIDRFVSFEVVVAVTDFSTKLFLPGAQKTVIKASQRCSAHGQVYLVKGAA